MVKKIAGFIFILLLISAEAFAAYTPQQWAAILNMSGRQRFLIQKMTKEMTLILAKIDVSKNSTELTKTSDDFNANLKRLMEGDSTLNAISSTDVQTQLKTVDGLWRKFKGLVDSVSSGKGGDIKQIADFNLSFLDAMDKVVELYAAEAKKETGKETSHFVNLAGKQRMLTQKMTKEAALILLNYDKEINIEALKGTMELFEQTLKGLESGDESLGLGKMSNFELLTLREPLKRVGEKWEGLKAIYQKFITGAGTDKDLAETGKYNEEIVKEFEFLVLKYGTTL
jgi:hypothetical protein